MKSRDRLIIVVGCGDLGALVSEYFSIRGYQVVTIDINRDAFANLSHDFSGFRLHGDATEKGTLVKAKVEDAYALIAATLEDSVNLMVTQIASKVYNVPVVMARVDDIGKAEIYTRFGIKTICPASVSAKLFIDEIEAESKGEDSVTQ